MDPAVLLENCDLLLPARDLWPTISKYIMDGLDHLANEFVAKYSPDYHAVFMRYWDRHKAEMIDKFDENFSRVICQNGLIMQVSGTI